MRNASLTSERYVGSLYETLRPWNEFQYFILVPPRTIYMNDLFNIDAHDLCIYVNHKQADKPIQIEISI